MIVIYDKGGGNFAETAMASAKRVFHETNVVLGTANPDQLPQAFSQGQGNYVVAHLSESQLSLLLKNWPTPVRALVRVSSQGAGGMPSYGPPMKMSAEGGGWILHASQRASDITAIEWQVIFQAIDAWKNGLQEEPLPQLVDSLYKNYEPALAFGLLCEAKQACEDGVQKDNFNGSGITIHAPMSIEDWLDPFGKKREDNNAIHEVAGIISSGEININTKVKTILESVTKNGDILQATIEDFFKKSR